MFLVCVCVVFLCVVFLILLCFFRWWFRGGWGVGGGGGGAESVEDGAGHGESGVQLARRAFLLGTFSFVLPIVVRHSMPRVRD